MIKISESDSESCSDKFWKTLLDRGHFDTWEIGGLDGVILSRGTIREKISDKLCGGPIVRSS